MAGQRDGTSQEIANQEITNKVREVFDQWAIQGRAEGMERGHGHAARTAFEYLGVRAGCRYLDIGCGNGYTIRWAAAIDASVDAVGLDLAPNMIERARSLSAHLPNARFVTGAFPSPEATAALAPATIDAAFSMEVFYYLPDLPAALAAVHTLLVPGGRFACVVDHYEENTASHAWSSDLGLPMHRLSQAAWGQALVDARLTLLRCERVRAPLTPGETPTWKHSEGSLVILAQRP